MAGWLMSTGLPSGVSGGLSWAVVADPRFWVSALYLATGDYRESRACPGPAFESTGDSRETAREDSRKRAGNDLGKRNRNRNLGICEISLSPPAQTLSRGIAIIDYQPICHSPSFDSIRFDDWLCLHLLHSPFVVSFLYPWTLFISISISLSLSVFISVSPHLLYIWISLIYIYIFYKYSTYTLLFCSVYSSSIPFIPPWLF